MSPWAITHANAYADVLSVVSWNVNEGLNVDCTSNLLNVCRYIGNRNPDIVCLQDIPDQMIVAGTYVTTYIEFIRLYVNAMYHIRYHVVTYGGLAILSKYPVTNSGEYLTPVHAIYTYITVNNIPYKLINCQLASSSSNQIGALAMVPFTSSDSENKLPIHDMYSDLLTQCYNNIPVVMCGRFTANANQITKSQVLEYRGLDTGGYDNVMTNAKWCKKINVISTSTESHGKTNMYNLVFTLIGLVG
jgi:exonuclease III